MLFLKNYLNIYCQYTHNISSQSFAIKLIHFITIFAIVSQLLFACASNENDEFKKQMLQYSSNQIYTMGKKELAKESYKKAIQYFEALEQIYPYGKESKIAMLDLAYAYYQNDQNDIAIAQLDSFIHTYPTESTLVPYALYLKASINYKIIDSTMLKITGQNVSERDNTNLIDSYQSFQEIVNKYPNSNYYSDALKKTKKLLYHLSEAEIIKARYYMSNQSYLAAIQRSENVITNYPHTQFVEEALAIIVYAYHKLHQDHLSSTTQAILNNNFPNSKYKNHYWSNHSSSWYSFTQE